ncbi:hypothetical protein [Novosphingobium sp.]|uniref:hypothetical protein n=1 Tax=Novosphingobium sp. TaxID=1874826 RepID=UPI0028A6A7B5|nr:hypothetical protein [Novosphingobium sp.]
MDIEIKGRVENLERAALEFEGAGFAVRHLLAHLLSRLDRDEAEECLREMQSTGRKHGLELGESRLTGYLDELDAIKAASTIDGSKALPPLRAVG